MTKKKSIPTESFYCPVCLVNYRLPVGSSTFCTLGHPATRVQKAKAVVGVHDAVTRFFMRTGK